MRGTTTGHEPARVVLITGEPGSGKTTLGTDLARAMRVPFIARDDVRGGLFVTRGAWSDHPGEAPRAHDAVEGFLRILETTAGLGVSCVAEYVVRRRRPQDLARITAAAECVVLVTWCRDTLDRLAARATTDRLLTRAPVLERLGYASVEEHTSDTAERMQSVIQEMQTEFDLPLLRVNTDDGYDPELDRIIAFATSTPRSSG